MWIYLWCVQVVLCSVVERKRPLEGSTLPPNSKEPRLESSTSTNFEDEEPSWERWKEIVLDALPESPVEETMMELPWNSSFSVRFRRNVVEQIIRDRDSLPYAPSMYDSREQSTPFGRLPLDRVVARTETSTIHAVVGENVVIKYQADCLEDVTLIHPLLIDFWFLQYLEPFRLSPKPFFVSPPTRLPPVKTHKSNVRISNAGYEMCVRMKSIVRYGIMSKVGKNLHAVMYDYTDQRIPFLDVLVVGRSLIRVLMKLHDEAGVVHGDIHTGNFCMTENRKNLIVIDFARSRFVQETLVDKQVREPGEWNDPWLSVWEIEGKSIGRRDDVFKALISLAVLMNGNDYYQFLNDINDDPERCLKIKRDGNLFLADPSFNAVDALPHLETTKAAIKEKLVEILDSSRAVKSAADRPDYEAIIASFDAIIALIQA